MNMHINVTVFLSLQGEKCCQVNGTSCCMTNGDGPQEPAENVRQSQDWPHLSVSLSVYTL